MARSSTSGRGRPKGARNKSTKQLKDMILAALDEAGGQAYLVEQAHENPKAFLTLISRVLPTTISGDKDAPLQVNHGFIQIPAKDRLETNTETN